MYSRGDIHHTRGVRPNTRRWWTRTPVPYFIAACTDCPTYGDITSMYKIAYSQTSVRLNRKSTEKHVHTLQSILELRHQHLSH